MRKFVRLLLLALLLGTTINANYLRLLQPGGRNDEITSPGYCIRDGGACP